MMSYTALEKFLEFFGGSTVEVNASDDVTLLWKTGWGEWRFVEVEPLYFRQVDANTSIAFREDDRGRITHMSTDLIPQFAFEKLSWYQTPRFNLALAFGSLLLLLSMIPVAAIRLIRNRRPSIGVKPEPRGAGVALGIIVGISILNLLVAVGTEEATVVAGPIPEEAAVGAPVVDGAGSPRV